MPLLTVTCMLHIRAKFKQEPAPSLITSWHLRSSRTLRSVCP